MDQADNDFCMGCDPWHNPYDSVSGPPSAFTNEWEPESAMKAWVGRFANRLRDRYYEWRRDIGNRLPREQRRDRLTALMLAGLVLALGGGIIQIQFPPEDVGMPAPPAMPADLGM